MSYDMDLRPKTILCDIDGTLVKHSSPRESASPNYKMELLPGTLDVLAEWDKLGYSIILITGRKESLRSITKKQLSEVGIFYDKLIMGIGSGERVLINDMKPNGSLTAKSFNLARDQGIQNLKI